MKRKWFRRLIGGMSFASALFLFQACYGTPHDLIPDLLIEGKVRSVQSGLPAQGIQVWSLDTPFGAITDEQGEFSFFMEMSYKIEISITDLDSTEYGNFVGKDTVLTNIQEKVYLDIYLEEKN